MTQRRTTYIKIPMLLVFSMGCLSIGGHPQSESPLLPYFDVVKEELFIPLPIDRLIVKVDSIINALDRKITIDQDYFHSKHFTNVERDIIMFLIMNCHLSIDGWLSNGHYWDKSQRLDNIYQYYDIRDWYNTNKDSINWFYYAELAMEDMGYILKRDSTGVYAERDTTLSPLMIDLNK